MNETARPGRLAAGPILMLLVCAIFFGYLHAERRRQDQQLRELEAAVQRLSLYPSTQGQPWQW